ncbi:type II secretion system F family protein [Alphaproteobacteria bacterium]|nr:type II secretion system F family protein [Alphaproteobacteria bacterium]
MNPVVIISLLILLIIIGAVISFFVLNEQTKKKQRMMSLIAGQSVRSDKKSSEADDQNKRRAEIARKLKEGDGGEEGDQKKKVTLSLMLQRAGLSISAKQFWLFSVVSLVATVLLAKLMGASPLVLVFSVIIGFLGVPRFVLRHMTKGRQKKFLEEFPDALEAMVRLLKAGMPVSEAISMISREFTGPMGEEMSRIYDKQKIGVALHEAALEATQRMPLTEVQMFATGLAIQAQTGSSLSEVLQNLSNVIRARFKLKRKIKALSSEAIASASIIGALPILLAGSMYFANHDYIMVLFTDSFGNVLLIGATVWMTIGIIVMKVMINFKI